jgi:16S rRNA processing protein RimM
MKARGPGRDRATDGPESGRVAVGFAGRAKGVRGEVLVESLTWNPDRFDGLRTVRLEREGQADLELRIERWRPDRGGFLMKFAGVDTPEQVRDSITGGYLTIPRDRVAPPPDGRYFVFDVVGCRVCDDLGRHLGEVTEVLQMPASDVFAVRLEDGGQFLLPAVREFVTRIDVDHRRIEVQGVEELLAPGG